MHILHRSKNVARCTVALAGFLGASFVSAGAQQTAPATPTTTPGLNLSLPAVDSASDATFSSSSADNGAVIAENKFDFVSAAAENAQPGQRRYGRPRYRGSNTNADGSSKYIFFGGAGFTQPLGNTYHYLTPNFGIQVGGGRQFSSHFALPIQFDYDYFGFNQRTLGQQAYIYSGDSNPSDNGIDGKSHIWSFSIDPTYTIYAREGLGAYVVAGVGFYHKVADFTAPQEEEYYSPYYGYETLLVQADIDHYTSNAVGFNGGFGLTYKFSRFSNEKFYGEVRYVYINNSQRQGITVNNLTTATATSTNFYPANSNRTTYLPVKFGIRF